MGRSGGRARLAAGVVIAAAAAGAPGAHALTPAPPDPDSRYALAHACQALVPAAGGDASGALRFQATDLGRYLLFTTQGRFLTAGQDGAVTPADRPSDAGDWEVEVDGDAFRLSLPAAGGRVLVAGPGGALRAVGAGDAAAKGDSSRFRTRDAQGCAAFPEVETNATGTPAAAPTGFGEVRGFVDAHMHLLAYEFLGGEAHCGRPWHKFGVTEALRGCEGVNGLANPALEGLLSGGSSIGDDPKGWPDFKGWPTPTALTHEQSYWKWLERAWLGGLRVYVNLFVDNEALCNVYPVKRNPCNDMNSVRLQAGRLRELQDYIDAQYGGPGKGFFRIVKDPFEARQVVRAGKLAIVPGIEVSRLFECGIQNGNPTCTREQVDRRLEEVHRLGVRQMELVNKFDNGLAGVAGDGGAFGVAINSANKATTGQFWQMQRCDHADEEAHDREQVTGAPGLEQDSLLGAIYASAAGPGSLPVYEPGPHCNAAGLTEVGEHLIRRMADKGMVFDPDHMSVKARNQALAVVEALRYPGVVSSHSWSTPDAFPRIYRLGGFIAPYAGDSTGFAKAWRETKAMRDPRFPFGFGYGADANGFGTQGQARATAAEKPMTYPFKSLDGRVTLDRQKSGTRTFDLNRDGVAHYGLYPDWIQDLRVLAGDQIVEDMGNAAEAYLSMWERAQGVPAPACRPARARFTTAGVSGAKLGQRTEALLRSAGQPGTRADRSMRWCAKAREGRKRGRLLTSLTAAGTVELVASTAPEHRLAGLGTGAKASRVPSRARRVGRTLRTLPAGRSGARYVIGVRDGRVRFVAVAAKGVAKTPARLRAALRRAGLQA